MTKASRFGWLAREIDEIRTRGFHVVDGPSSGNLRVVNDSILPPSYRSFVAEFGQAKLYKQKTWYLVGVLAVPQDALDPVGLPILCIGHYQSARAYLRKDDLVVEHEAPVHEWGQNGLRRIADDFESWLVARASAARRQFPKREWQRIVDGPPPFSAEELEVLEARRAFRWRVVGISESGDIRFEVTNGSTRVLPYLTIGIRSPQLEGAVWLPVERVLPGESAIIEKGCYKKQVSPTEVQPFDLGDPRPEDRELFWEFRTAK